MSKNKPPLKNKFLQNIKNKFFHPILHSKDAFFQVLKEAEENHIIDSHSRSIIEGAIQVENIQVRDVMVPKSKMVMLEYDMPTKTLLKIMVHSAHSRFPVLNSQKDKIQGIILAKDLLGYLAGGQHQHVRFDYKEYLRTAILVPESKTLSVLLRDFQQKKSHMAIVMDEYGEIAGLVTLEDILEQIVGEIEDEHDFEQDNIIDVGQQRYLLKANTSLTEFNEFFNADLQLPNVDTIAGFVVASFTRLPEQMSEIELQGFYFKVLKTDSRSVRLLQVTKQAPAKNNDLEAN